MRCQTFSFSFFPCSADHERDWPPCKVVFFGLATNALNVRNNNNNNARGQSMQSTAELQQQHVDRLHRHTIHTTSAGMAHANGPTARATVNSTSWWWGQEQRVVLSFGDADTTQKATGATSAQIDFVCVICTGNSSTAAVASLSLPLSLRVSFKEKSDHT